MTNLWGMETAGGIMEFGDVRQKVLWTRTWLQLMCCATLMYAKLYYILEPRFEVEVDLTGPLISNIVKNKY